MKMIRTAAWVYSALFFTVVILGYIPPLVDANGYLLGLYHIDPVDDIVHLISGIWAAVAASRSTGASIFYFRAFGTIYSLDAVFGLLFGEGILDGGIVRNGIAQGDFDLFTRIASNAPHVVIGGLAMIIGFIVSRRLARAENA